MNALRTWLAAALCTVVVAGCGGGSGPSSSDAEKLQKEVGPNYIGKMNMGEDDEPANAQPAP